MNIKGMLVAAATVVVVMAVVYRVEPVRKLVMGA